MIKENRLCGLGTIQPILTYCALHEQESKGDAWNDFLSQSRMFLQVSNYLLACFLHAWKALPCFLLLIFFYFF